MRIFTLGRNGVPLFLFALILFSGTYSSYGQQAETCPTVVDDGTEDGNQQFFCDSESFLVQDLQASGTEVVWYADDTFSTPLEPNEVLIDGEDYFALEADPNAVCANAPSVTVTIYAAPDILGINETTRSKEATKQSLPILFFCVADVNDSNITLDNVRTSADDTGTVQWYANRTTTVTLNPANTELVHGATYYVDQASPEGCRSTRNSVTINLSSEAAPTGAGAQEFCLSDSPTLADIDASGDNNYYTTANGNIQLAETTPLTEDTVVFVSSVGPTCESINRLRVAVTVSPVEITQTEQSLCENQSEGNNLGLATVAHLSPAGGIWYADENFSVLLPADTQLEDGTTYYLAPENCASTSVNVTLTDTPNAGQTSTAFYCVNEGPSDLYDQITNPEHLEEDGIEVDRGTINHPAFNNTDPDQLLLFDPADLGVGTHVLRHTVTVPEGSLCESDSAQITIVVQEAPEAGSDITETLCTAQFSDLEALQAEFAGYLAGRDLNGTFDDNLTTGIETLSAEGMGLLLLGQYNALNRTAFSLTYTVINDNCEDSAQININIVESPDAGDGGTIQLVKDTTNDITLDQANEGTPVTGGTWTTSNDTVVGGDFAPQEPGVYTYTVAAGECSASATVTVLDVPQDCPVVTEATQRFCRSISTEEVEFKKPTVSDLKPQTATWYATATSSDALTPDTELIDGEVYYAGTANEDCTERPSVTVTFFDTPNAGGGGTIYFCENGAPENLVESIGESILGAPQMTGTFTPNLVDNMFDPADYEVGDSYSFRYTVEGNENCPTDESRLTVKILAAPNAGTSTVYTVPEGSTEVVNLLDELGPDAQAGGEWNQGNGMFDPATDEPGDYTYTVTVVSPDGERLCSTSATVTVEMEVTQNPVCPVVEETEQAFCESILTGNNSRLPNVSDLLPAGATWYTSAEDTEALAADTPLVNGAVYFAGNVEGTCEARESVTVTLDDSPNAGGTTPLTFCEGGEAVDLLTLINPSILGAPDAGGTITPALASGTTLFDPAVDAAGSYTYSVASTNDVCPADEATINITITPAANAGGTLTLNFCTTDDPQDLFTHLPEGVSTDGTFEGIEDGIFDPAVDAPGEFTYSVEQTGDCEGTSTATVIINVAEAPEAPVAEAQSFCGSEGATVAELVAEGEDLLWYTDAALETLADEADALVEGTYYVTTTNEGGCESAATEVAVSFTDAAAPTLTQGGNIFCEFDNPTIANLEANVDAAGTITWYDAATGGNEVLSSELLEDGVTYYAASTDATSACESSVRLSVSVDLSDCPVVIPDAFSPNGDDINDTFEITNIAEEFPNYTIEIYNRWGNIVFKGNASTPNWDGVSTESRSLGDSVLPVGVYFYIVNYNDGQTAPTQGRLYLSR